MSQSQLDDLWPEAIAALQMAERAFRSGEQRIAAVVAIRRVLKAYAAITGPSPALQAVLDAVSASGAPAHMTDPELVAAIWGDGRAERGRRLA